jgi:hypothetical protein
MKTEPTITIEVDTDGHIVVEVHGVQGPACQALTKELEESLGTLTKKTLKPECNQINLTGTQQRGQTLGGASL